MAKQSAGILLYRFTAEELEVLLVHPGGPFFRNKDKDWWKIPKGEVLSNEQPFDAATREFHEETGYLPHGNFMALNPASVFTGA
nr:NUDIX domain-containing protein [Pedobacter panaciterrae]